VLNNVLVVIPIIPSLQFTNAAKQLIIVKNVQIPILHQINNIAPYAIGVGIYKQEYAYNVRKIVRHVLAILNVTHVRILIIQIK
jgi:hypothetical protein